MPYNVPEKRHSVECWICGGDHPDMLCDRYQSEAELEELYCKCGTELQFPEALDGMPWCSEHGVPDIED